MMEYRFNIFPEKWETMLLPDFNWNNCTTRYLLKLRDDVRYGAMFQIDEYYKENDEAVDNKYKNLSSIVYDILSTREHIPNKLEAKAIRIQKAKEQRNR